MPEQVGQQTSLEEHFLDEREATAFPSAQILGSLVEREEQLDLAPQFSTLTFMSKSYSFQWIL